MLFDPKWTKTYTLEDLISWLETKDPNEKYTYYKAEICLVGQWTGQIYGNSDDIDPNTFLGCEEIAFGYPWTFGAALERARELRQQTGR